MTNEDRKEIIIKGAFLGLILFISTLINLLINKDMQHLQTVGNFIFPVIAGYCLLGMFIRWMAYRSTIRKNGVSLFSGAAIVYWVWMISTIFIFCAYWIPQVIRYTILANVIALLLVWYIDYLYLKNIAKELNSGLEYYKQVLVEDLTVRPHTEEMFIEQIYNYCNKNHLSLEIIEYGIPAKIEMNNTMYIVRLGEYYNMMGGIVYTLEFHNVVSRLGSN